MTDHRLGRRPGHAVGARTEQLAHAAGLDRVVEDGRRAVKVDVADFLERTPRSFDRQPHGADDLLAVRIHLHAMIGVTGRAVAVDRRIDMRAAGARAILALEDDHPRTFAKHEPITAAIERSGGFGRPIVVRRGHGAHPGEAEDHARRDAGVGAA